MKKIAVILFLSFLVGMVNASTMPITLGEFSHTHCEEVATPLSHDGSQPVAKLTAGHYCCSAIAVLHTPLIFTFNKSSDLYLPDEMPKSISNISESIYRPPKHDL